MTQEALSSLRALGNQLRLKLLESAEFRALTIVDKTILELSEILGASAPALPDCVAPAPAAYVASPRAVDEQSNAPSATISRIPPRAERLPLSPAGSHSRMAKAIAETIAARAASLNASSAAAARFDQALSVAS
jgi:hypothetical protein